MTASEVFNLVEAHPWFAGARVHLCRLAMEASGREAAEEVLRENLCYLPCNSPVTFLSGAIGTEDFTDADLKPGTYTPRNAGRTYVAGMDYFSREDYESAKADGDADLAKIAIVDYSKPEGERIQHETGSMEVPGFITETLAQIYIEQGYPAQAIDIYTKLSLQMPEKSAYFATLIDKLKN